MEHVLKPFLTTCQVKKNLTSFSLNRNKSEPIQLSSSLNLESPLLSSLWGLHLKSSTEQAVNLVSGNLETPRRMEDSYCELSLPFADSKALREEYAAFYGGIRLGKLLEDLDILAACIAYSHCNGNCTDISIVTAAVNRIDIFFHLPVANYSLCGNVVNVGRSSMDVCILIQSEEKTFACASFTMVARNAKEHSKSISVNPLLAETELEKNVRTQAELEKRERMKSKASLLSDRMNFDFKSEMIEHNFIEHENASLLSIEDTLTVSTKLCHLQEKNIHNYIFGGYLMKEAYDLAYINAFKFMKGDAFAMESLGEISFLIPVEIGSVLEFVSKVVYVNGDRFCVSVIAHHVSPKSAGKARNITNTFSFTFRAFDKTLPFLLPHTDEDKALYLESKKRFQSNSAILVE